MPSAAIPIGAAVAGGAASAFVGSKLAPKVNTAGLQGPLARNLATPGFNVRTANDTVSLGRSPATTATLERLGLLSKQRGDKLAGLLPKVQAGFSDFRRVGVAGLENARSRAVGDLRENLARRRVQGSSFANDAIARAEAEFGQTRAEFEAQTMLRELAETERLITERTRELQGAAARELDQSNFEIGAAANFANGVNVVASNNAAVLAQLESNAAQSAGAFFQPVVSAIGSAVSSGVSGLFSGGSPNQSFDSTDFR